MNYYEKIVILDPNLDDAAAEEFTGKIKDVIIKQGGELFNVDNWGRRKLAYELNKQQKGNYTLLQFKAPASTIIEIEKLCKVTDSVLKFMVLKLTKKKQIESILPKAASASVKPDEAIAAPGEVVRTEEGVPSQEEK